MREHAQVAGVEPDRAELRAGQLDADPHRLGDVVGVHEQRRAGAEGGDLRTEGIGLGVVEQRERVRAGAGARHAVTLTGGEVRGGGEAGDVRRPRAGDRRLLVRAAGPHLDAGAVTRGPGHARGGGGDRGVVVVDAQQQRLQHHRLGEAGLDHHQRRVAEVGLALGVAPDVAGEPVVGQPVGGRVVDHALAPEEPDLLVAEPELLDRIEGAADARHHAVPPALGEPAREQLEDRASVPGAVGQGGLQHRELVVVREQRSRGGRGGHCRRLVPDWAQ